MRLLESMKLADELERKKHIRSHLKWRVSEIDCEIENLVRMRRKKLKDLGKKERRIKEIENLLRS